MLLRTIWCYHFLASTKIQRQSYLNRQKIWEQNAWVISECLLVEVSNKFGSGCLETMYKTRGQRREVHFGMKLKERPYTHILFNLKALWIVFYNSCFPVATKTSGQRRQYAVQAVCLLFRKQASSQTHSETQCKLTCKHTHKHNTSNLTSKFMNTIQANLQTSLPVTGNSALVVVDWSQD